MAVRLRISKQCAKSKILRFAIPGLLFCGAAASARAAPPPATPAVVAYVFARNGVLPSVEIDAAKLTRVNYAFANLQGGRMVPGYPSDGDNLAALLALKQENPALSVLVSVGGWLWSDKFSDMALTKESRSLFIDSAVEFLDHNHLDGLDLDWEYPGMAGAGHTFRPEDKQNYTLLLKELRKRFNREETRLHRKLFLTIATGASSQFLAHTEMKKVQKYVDTVNLMAYDYYEPTADRITGHHAPLFTNPADPKHISADQSVVQYEQAGVPAAKLVLGVPFYGHPWGEVPDQNHGLFQPGKPLSNAYVEYRDVSEDMLNNGFIRYWDPVASVPYLYNPEKHIFVSYEDSESLRLKCNYIVDHKLAGIMFWEYSSDSAGLLLRTIDASFHASRARAVSPE
jgi:chitinase